MALVGHISLAMQHVRQFEIARETSLTLQRSMLPPSTLPAGFAVRYEPAVPPLEIGGDFYDVLPVGENRIGIVVGDCVGRGLSAAAVMGQLRASTRALLLTGAEPAKLLEQLDSVAEFIPDAFCATVFVAIVDTDSQTVHYSSAGHVPPVFATGSSPPELLTDGHSVPLAVQRDKPRPQAAARWRRARHCCCTPTAWSSGATDPSTNRSTESPRWCPKPSICPSKPWRTRSCADSRRRPDTTTMSRSCSIDAHRRRLLIDDDARPATVERCPAPAGRVAERQRYWGTARRRHRPGRQRGLLELRRTRLPGPRSGTNAHRGRDAATATCGSASPTPAPGRHRPTIPAPVAGACC